MKLNPPKTLSLLGLTIYTMPIIPKINAIVIKAINGNCLLTVIVRNYQTYQTFVITNGIIDFR